MGTIRDYTEGKILTDISKAYHVFRKHEGSLAGSDVGRRMLKNIAEFDPAVINMNEAVVALQSARTIAVGESAADRTLRNVSTGWLKNLTLNRHVHLQASSKFHRLAASLS